jgi:hypothetical protein
MPSAAERHILQQCHSGARLFACDDIAIQCAERPPQRFQQGSFVVAEIGDAAIEYDADHIRRIDPERQREDVTKPEPSIVVGKYRGMPKSPLGDAIGNPLRRSVGVRGVKAYERMLSKVSVERRAILGGKRLSGTADYAPRALPQIA